MFGKVSASSAFLKFGSNTDTPLQSA